MVYFDDLQQSTGLLGGPACHPPSPESARMPSSLHALMVAPLGEWAGDLARSGVLGGWGWCGSAASERVLPQQQRFAGRVPGPRPCDQSCRLPGQQGLNGTEEAATRYVDL